jgi:hypothetical protein
MSWFRTVGRTTSTSTSESSTTCESDLSTDSSVSTLFRGVSTHLQLGLTLLRLGEANEAPIPPPARVHHAPPDDAIDIDSNVVDALPGDEPMGVSQQKLEDLAEHNPNMASHAGGADTEVEQAAGHGEKREKAFDMLKAGTRGAAKLIAGAEKLQAKVGAATSRQRAGVVPSSRDQTTIVGPVEFSARYDGQKGFVYVNSGAEEPFLAFNRRSIRTASGGNGGNGDSLSTDPDLHTVWTLKIDDIRQLRKHSGYGMKAKLMAGWATNAAIYDDLRIVDAQDKSWVVTALPYRDALFNRLFAISSKAKWEVW